MPRSVCSSIMSQTTRATSVQQSKPAGAVPPSVLNAATSAEQPAHPSSSSQVGTTKSIPAPAKPPSVAPSGAASAVTTSVAAKSATPSQISGAPSMTSTAALRTRLASLEAKLEVERQERVAASKKIEETQRELDALEKLLKLQP